jgi:hypothetical protein
MGPQTAQLLTEVFPQLNLAKDRSDLDEEIDYVSFTARLATTE